MGREAFGTNWLKLEIHPDPRYLLPDSTETLKATEELVKLKNRIVEIINQLSDDWKNKKGKRI